MKINSSFLRTIDKTFARMSPTAWVRGILCLAFAVVSVSGAQAFRDDTYAGNSVLASGKWVKISVPQSGLYAVTPAQLRQWGFTDPSRIRICGYGGKRIEDMLSTANYIDDLPVVPTFAMDNGNIAFYGVGPESWTLAVNGRYVRNNNIYTTQGYYFVTQIEESDSVLTVPEITLSGRPTATAPLTSFWDRMQHEQDLYSPGQAGPQLVGEDFRYTPTRDFNFQLTDRVEDDSDGIWFETSFVAKTLNQASQLTFTANGTKVTTLSSDKIPATTSDSHYHGTEGVTRHTLNDISGNTLNLKINHSAPVIVQGAWLNYIAVNYQRKLQLDNNGQLMFWAADNALSLGNATTGTRILDVTSPQNISEISASELTSDGRKQWTPGYTGMRTYVAFNTNASLPSPSFVGNVTNQDLHGQSAGQVPDMVILCPASMMSQAQRIVTLHANDKLEPLDVKVVDIEKVYNEFSSGMADVSGIRKYFKYLWDKGMSDAPEGYSSKFRYAILLGRTSYDSRMITEELKSFADFVLPTWMGGNMRQSLNDTDGYGTDDFMALLKDNSGTDKGLDDLCIAIGRIPVRTVAEATSYIDKLEQYMTSAKKTSWKNSVMFLADDGDNGRHLEQSENFIKNMTRIDNNPLFVNKVYMDAFIREGGVYPLARESMFRLLNEGVVWWNYIGHANDHSLTHNGQLTYNDLNNMFYKNIPVFYGATCDFLRWDQNSLSGGEIMFLERYGGAISIISATRPVYIYENGLLSNAFGRHLGARDPQGRLLTVGEIYRRAKNNILTDAGAHLTNSNRLKFVLMGDPAMRLATPSGVVEITDIDGKSLDNFNDDPVELHGLQSATVRGVIKDIDGDILNDFNGVVTITLYDAEYSTTTHGYPDNDTEGKVVTFEQQGARLSATSATVQNGTFEAKLSVPLDIADNYRTAAITMYAYSTENNDEASGLTKKLYVYGYDESAPADTQPPVIESMYLNHESFVDGATIDASPMLIARVSDDIAINLSTAGIGHMISLQLDGTQMFTDVSLFYTPSTDGSPSGTINYPLSDLRPGDHTLTLKVWDTSANLSTASLSFNVSDRIAPKIYNIFTDASPAHDKANFYITHDRPDQMATVTVEVFNLLGQPQWSKTSTGVSDMFVSTPVTWDLTDHSGRRVQRGIYLYRATITVDGETFDTGSRRIAVAAQ